MDTCYGYFPDYVLEVIEKEMIKIKSKLEELEGGIINVQ